MKNKKPRPGRNGFTLIETLVAVLILSVGILASLMFFVQAQVSTQLAQDMTVATTHADYVFEEMYGLPTLQEIRETSWTAWARQAGLTSLPQEKVTVTFDDSEGRLLPVRLSVSWRRKGREHRVDLATEITK